jgi:dihydrofolate reductase
MRRLVVQEFVSVDGFAAGPGGDIGFIPEATEGDDGLAENQMRFIDTVDTIVLGRVTYEMFAGYWPTATGDDKPFADKINAMPKLVFSRTLERAPWGSSDDALITTNEPAPEVRRMKEENGKDLVVWGSLSLAQSLAGQGEVDEYQLWVLPIVLGGGTPLVSRDKPGALKLREAKTTQKGAVLLSYEPS